MAYMSAADAAIIRADLAAAFPKGKGWKFSVRKGQGSVSVNILAAPVRFEAWDWDSYAPDSSNIPRSAYHAKCDKRRRPVTLEDVNHYWFKDHHPGRSAAVFRKALRIIMRKHWDKSDTQSDYFNCAFYVNFGVGDTGKPCVYTGKP